VPIQPRTRSAIHPFVLAVLFCGPFCLLGQDTSEVTKPMRIYMIGNSLTDNVRYEAFQKLAESQGYEHIWGRSMTPGAPICWHWEHEPAFTQKPFGAYRKALVEYEWDAITFQPFNSFQKEFEALLKFIKLLRPKEPSTLKPQRSRSRRRFDGKLIIVRVYCSTATKGVRFSPRPSPVRTDRRTWEVSSGPARRQWPLPGSTCRARRGRAPMPGPRIAA